MFWNSTHTKKKNIPKLNNPHPPQKNQKHLEDIVSFNKCNYAAYATWSV